MGEDGSRALRFVRAGLLASLTLSLAVGAHVVAGGALPASALLVALGALTLAAASVLGRRRLRRRSLVPTMAGGQWALHHAITALAVPVPTVGALPPAAGPHAHGAVELPVVGASAVDVLGASLAMTLAHAVAGGVVALVAVSADRAWAVAVARVGQLFPVLVVALGALLPVRAPRVRRSRRTRVRVPAAVLLSARPRRGPPPGLLVLA